jgi:hypothetical protein
MLMDPHQDIAVRSRVNDLMQQFNATVGAGDMELDEDDEFDFFDE